MKSIERGVSKYTNGKAMTTIYFPNGNNVCRWCHLFLKYEENYKRYSCRLTGEWILDPLNERGTNCPLKIEEE